ncbi:uncharacterized protein TRIADDRAFT_57933 [Trichoplax adhaerens]|uniref:XK-related protein n=1 Tax=Trichoplax adhaerens TaxID=10228 RepID=B3S257_TRIAD|nr:hypothetical protein TRIADDRAFT_57933 [Trichoplax adhaerens]EDV23055.1 hypothetical protein TRIADDRAFT_57933 [Trichoplax adhaerens]|eukprot:XP_002113965.1 hypothetical protein TRIADDRAFT_57933 [Trichoplax adhaerens]
MWSTSCCDKTKRASHNGGPYFYISHFFCLSQVQRKIYIFYKGMKNHTERQHISYLYDLHDAYLMDLVESFIESAPQVVLQMYILLNKEKSDFITTLSVLISGVAVAVSLVQYSKTLHEAHYPPKQRLSLPGIMMIFIWRYLFILCRSVFLGLFAVVFTYFVFVLMGCHWLFFTFYLWYTENGKEQFPESALKRIIYCVIGGFIYIFCVFNLKNGKSRSRYILYYIITILEMAVAMTIWLLTQQLTQMRMFALLVIIGGYFFGFLSMISYYACFHPNRLNYLPDKLQELSTTQYYFRGIREVSTIQHANRPTNNQFTFKQPKPNVDVSQPDIPRPMDDLPFQSDDNVVAIEEPRTESDNVRIKGDKADDIDGENVILGTRKIPKESTI